MSLINLSIHLFILAIFFGESLLMGIMIPTITQRRESSNNNSKTRQIFKYSTKPLGTLTTLPI
jgi:hypothetical protein